MRAGHEMTSKTREPAIWPAKVDVKEVIKKAKKNLESLFMLKAFVALACKGEDRIIKPNV